VRRRLMFIVAGVGALAAFALGGAALAGATQGSEEDADEPTPTGQAAEQAKAAALKETGGGSVTELERDPEEGRVYEVEVKKPDGSVVDIDLDGSFKVVAVDEDTDEATENANEGRSEAGDKEEPNDTDD
jgi:Peptidase propeptide and YPEB domain